MFCRIWWISRQIIIILLLLGLTILAYSSEEAVVVIEFPEQVQAYLSGGQPKWSWTTRFKETGGNVGYEVTGKGYIYDKYGRPWGPIGGGPINRGTLNVPAGGSCNDSYWCRGSVFVDGHAQFTWSGTDDNGNSIYLVERVKLIYKKRPVISNIPDQTIKRGERFAEIHLDDCVSDQDNADHEIVWTYYLYDPLDPLEVNISSSRIATITVLDPEWTGSGWIRFTATDPYGLSDFDWVMFTVEPRDDSEFIFSSTGLHCISLPMQPFDISVGSVLGQIEDSCDYVLTYESNSGWRWYIRDNSFLNNLTEIVSGKGYWFMINETCSINIQGGQAQTEIHLKRGWNLVGFGSHESMDILDCISSIVDKCISVWEYSPDRGWKVYIPNEPDLSNLQKMYPWYGYYMLVSDDCVWNIN